ncbi:hypothetical protein J6590_044809 [Homalodisca vitripennis]|nr:hypothetical protein J6590_044809 [Homalodisca vitripennis]
MNAKLSRVNLEITCSNLVGKEKDFQNWDLILVGDLFYDWKVVDPLMPMLREACKQGKVIYLGDPSTIMKSNHKDLTTKATYNLSQFTTDWSGHTETQVLVLYC